VARHRRPARAAGVKNVAIYLEKGISSVKIGASATPLCCECDGLFCLFGQQFMTILFPFGAQLLPS
jgi:hypothetical protein